MSEFDYEKTFKPVFDKMELEYSQQFAECLLEAIKSQDFMAHTTRPEFFDDKFSQKLAISYIPYREVEKLKQQILDAENVIRELVLHDEYGCDAPQKYWEKYKK
jgi:hypothetical protein